MHSVASSFKVVMATLWAFLDITETREDKSEDEQCCKASSELLVECHAA